MWQSGMTSGEPDTLYNFPITINQHMASVVEADAVTMLFGLFSKYKIRQVRAVRLRRLVERYADTDEEGFVAFTRIDGNLLEAGTAPIKSMVQA
jgi:HK97 family phage major capsid protein